MPTANEIIDKIKSLDLGTISPDVIVELLRQFDKVAFMEYIIPAGAFVFRSRRDDEFVNHSYERDISYIKDASKITKINRASFEHQPIFYGCISTYENDESEHHCQLLSMAEVSAWEHHEVNEKVTEAYITMGKWRVQEDFSVGIITNYNEFTEKNVTLKDLNHAFVEITNQFPEKKESLIALSEFVSAEFAKKVSPSNRHEYKISAAFASIVFKHGLPGLIYPKGVDEFIGFNVALQPAAVNKFLKLEKVIVMREKKILKQVFEVPYLFCDSFQNDGRFIWQDGTVAPLKFVNDKIELIQNNIN